MRKESLVSINKIVEILLNTLTQNLKKRQHSNLTNQEKLVFQTSNPN